MQKILTYLEIKQKILSDKDNFLINYNDSNELIYNEVTLDTINKISLLCSITNEQSKKFLQDNWINYIKK